MGYVKLVKNKNYYKRYKVKMKRRRQCKTDYEQRRALIAQDKRKHNVPKWRFVVRVTNTDVTCQVVSAKVIGDHVLCAAYAHELRRYGLNVGLTNYAACYCTGLLLARRLLKKIKLDKIYQGKEEADGEMFRSNVEDIDWEQDQKIYRPFKCNLDIGLARATTGARIFGAMKGAVDGGLDIPHSEKRFPGFVPGDQDQDDEYQADVHADKIYGGHVRDYMEKLQESDPAKYQKHFSKYIAENLGPENLKEKYMEIHQKIRENPSAAPKKKRDLSEMKLFPKRPQRLSTEERRERRIARIAQLARAGQDDDEKSDE